MTVDPVQQTLERLQQVSSSSTILRTATTGDSNHQHIHQTTTTTTTTATLTTSAAYTILVESDSSLAIRQALTQVDDINLYRQAGLRTPAENAHLDWYGVQPWWNRLVTQVCVPSSSNPVTQMNTNNPNPRRVIYLQSIPRSFRRQKRGKPLPQEPFVIDLTVDPWGWENDDDMNINNKNNDNKTTVVGMNSLKGIVNVIQAHLLQQKQQQQQQSTISSTALVVDSLTPLWIRHGKNRVILFLQCLQQLEGISMIILHAASSSTTINSVHPNNDWIRALEDHANALLLLQQGQALWMHQGIRERDNMIRQSIEYDVVTDDQKETVDAIRIVAKVEKIESPKDQHEHEPIQQNERSVDPNVSTPSGTRASIGAAGRGRPRVKLQLEEESDPPARPTTTQSSTAPPPSAVSSSSSGPRIFMQDDDKEFEDYDEEDPDDDLEI